MLTVITGTIEILAEGVKHDPALASIAKMINDAADRASQLTANLLAFARKQPLRPLETDVNALIEQVVELLAPTLGRQIEIRTALSDEAWPALVDRSQLNLGAGQSRHQRPRRHARRWTAAVQDREFHRHPNGAEVGELGAGDYVIIEVIDSGAGIPLAIRDRIFEPFFSTKQFGTGTGLGLSMVFGFAKQSGGAIVVDGEEGKGACFRIYLPKADAEPSDALRRATPRRRKMNNCAAVRKPSCASRMTTSCARTYRPPAKPGLHGHRRIRTRPRRSKW